MKKVILTIILLLFFKVGFSQASFPYNEQLQDTLGFRVPSKTFTNFGKPLVIEFFGSHCKPCIELLDSFKEVYPEWKQKYGAKIIVIVTDKRYKRKKLMKLIKEHNWPFQFYIDKNQRLFNRLTNSNIVPQTLIFDGNHNIIGKFKGVKPNYGYKIVDGKVTNERVRIRNIGDLNNLDCDLTQYEDTLEFIIEQKNN